MGIYVVGYARHGKDTVAEILAEQLCLTFESSSLFCCRKVIYPTLKDKYGYSSVDECYDDRSNHRAEWYELIKEYNGDDLARVSREIFKEYDLYVGIRNKAELEASLKEGLSNTVIWVDASERLPPEASDSMTVTRDMATYEIDNNGTYEALRANVRHAIHKLNLPSKCY